MILINSRKLIIDYFFYKLSYLFYQLCRMKKVIIFFLFFCFNLHAFNDQLNEKQNQKLIQLGIDSLNTISTINFEYNSFVKLYMDSYLIKDKQLISKMLAISKHYFPIFEQKLDKYNLYSPQKISKYKSQHKYRSSLTDPLYNLLSHCDGKTSLIEIADKILVPVWELYPIINNLKNLKLIKIKHYKS